MTFVKRVQRNTIGAIMQIQNKGMNQPIRSVPTSSAIEGAFPSSVSEFPLLQVRRPTLYVNRRQSAQMLYSTPSGKLTPPGNTTMIGQLEIEPLA